jgi:hypothetical protein
MASPNDYKRFIEENLQIVDKTGSRIDFKLNAIQDKYLLNDCSGRDIILKFRQPGLSSLITGIFTTDFILRQNSYSVIVADIDDNAEGLLSKVKIYIESYEEKNKMKVPLKYNSKSELYNPFMNTTFKIGTAKNTEFGRSRTITNLHLSEVAFYPNIKNLIAGAGQAVVEDGRLIMETTANGFNDLKRYYEDGKNQSNGFKSLFYRASDFYSKEFLEKKRVELKEKYPQEYPENDIEAFITSGNCYFDKNALQVYLRESSDYRVINDEQSETV